MGEFVKINSEILYNAVYQACFRANIYLPEEVYGALKKIDKAGLEPKSKMTKIFANAFIASKNVRPLCQDTGQIICFVSLGSKIQLDKPLNDVINSAVEACYRDNFLRKSVVKDAFFDRNNTKTNTPAIIYTEIAEGEEIKINMLVKGGGAENMSALKMFNPSASEQEIMDFVLETVKNAGENACPPLFLGIGLGGTADYALVLSKKAFFIPENRDFCEKLKNYVNENSPTKVADVKMLSAQTHIASLPVGITVNCHSTRHASVVINGDGFEILSKFAEPDNLKINSDGLKEVCAQNAEEIRKLKTGEEVLLTGTIYTARDMAHKRLAEMLKDSAPLPFDLKNSIIFYAGPCPKTETEVIGPIGPTTAKRMDKFAPLFYNSGVSATIGKGARSSEVKESIKNNNAIYFSMQGGVASLMQSCVKAVKIMAFEDLGTEAVYELKVDKLPLKVELGRENE